MRGFNSFWCSGLINEELSIILGRDQVLAPWHGISRWPLLLHPRGHRIECPGYHRQTQCRRACFRVKGVADDLYIFDIGRKTAGHHETSFMFVAIEWNLISSTRRPIRASPGLMVLVPSPFNVAALCRVLTSDDPEWGSRLSGRPVPVFLPCLSTTQKLVLPAGCGWRGFDGLCHSCWHEAVHQHGCWLMMNRYFFYVYSLVVPGPLKASQPRQIRHGISLTFPSIRSKQEEYAGFPGLPNSGMNGGSSFSQVNCSPDFF